MGSHDYFYNRLYIGLNDYNSSPGKLRLQCPQPPPIPSMLNENIENRRALHSLSVSLSCALFKSLNVQFVRVSVILFYTAVPRWPKHLHSQFAPTGLDAVADHMMTPDGSLNILLNT